MSDDNTNNVPESVAGSDSIFKIDGVMTVNRDNVPTTFLSGMIEKGTLHAGEGIVVFSGENKPVLTCKITGIERIGRDTFQEITFKEDGTDNDNAYGLWVDNDNADLFKEGYYITSLVNGKNKTNKDRLSAERMDELAAMIDNSDIESFRFLTIQELSAIVQKMKKDNDPSKQARLSDVTELLYKKILEADTIYLTLDNTTRAPFFNNGCVDIYSLKSYAEDAVDFYGKQFRKLSVFEANKENLQVPLFVWLTLFGVKTVTVDNGQHHVPLEVERFLTDEDKKSTIIEETPAHPPFYNPGFRFAMNTCLSELRWPVNYPERQANCERKDKEMWEAFKSANLIVPIKQRDENGEESRTPEGQVAIPHINNAENEEFIGLFTDIDEMRKLYKLDDWGIMIMGPKQVLELDDKVGIVINPMGENLVITKDKLPEYRERVLGSATPDLKVVDDPEDEKTGDPIEDAPPVNVQVEKENSDGSVDSVENESNDGGEGPSIKISIAKDPSESSDDNA